MPHINEITLTGEDVIRAHSALLTHVRDLEQHLSWLNTREGKPLPGTEVAIEQITLEIADYRQLCLKIGQARLSTEPAWIEIRLPEDCQAIEGKSSVDGPVWIEDWDKDEPLGAMRFWRPKPTTT